MPTDLPPDYKPAPKPTPENPGATVPDAPSGQDSRDPGGSPTPAPAGLPGRDGDAVDPGWGEPPRRHRPAARRSPAAASRVSDALRRASLSPP